MKFYRCNKCGQIVAEVNPTNIPIICCEEEMKEILPKTKDPDFGEKHIPTYKRINDTLTVTIGSVLHPMKEEHYIMWVAITTNKGNQRKCLKPGDAPVVDFKLMDDEKVCSIYAYCNIHSLYKLEVSNCNKLV